MLIKYIVKNFRSFKDETTFSFISGRGTIMKEHKLQPVKGISVLKTAIVFGANASGKSNLVKAIAFGKDLLLREKQADTVIDYQPYMLDDDSAISDSEMIYDIQTNRKNYSYGFIFNRYMIIEEWLIEKSKRGTDQSIFSLKRNKETKEITFNFDYLKKKNTKEESRQFIQFIAKATPKNRLFLHEVLTRNMSQNVEHIEDLLAIINWFEQTLQIILPDETYKMGFTLKAAGSDDLRYAYSALLKYFDTGIETINLVDVDFDKILLPPELARTIRRSILQKEETEKFGSLSFNGELFLVSSENGLVKAQKLMTVHNADSSDKKVPFDLNNESDGTLRLLDYIPLIIDLMMGNKVFIVDEMERSLHPNLMKNLIELFTNLSEGINSQLILTTHESTLMTQELFRKDEIWFVQKDHGHSSLVSLDNYHERFDKDIRTEYLKGTYKGVPNMGNIEPVRDLFKKKSRAN
jgi:AAA15 family ATPase/GTPase